MSACPRSISKSCAQVLAERPQGRTRLLKALQDDKQGTPGKLFYGLIKAKNTRFVTDAQERRALARMASYDRQTLVQRAGELNGLPAPLREETQHALFGDRRSIGYHHGVMMQCFLPQKPLPAEQREYQITHGRVSLLIEAGRLANPKRPNEFKRCGLPYGSRARLIIPYINAYAVILKTREIDLGRSLRGFMEKIGSPTTSYNGNQVTEQIQALAAAQFILGEWSEDGTTTKYGRFAEEVSLWPEGGIADGPTIRRHVRWLQASLLCQDSSPPRG